MTGKIIVLTSAIFLAAQFAAPVADASGPAGNRHTQIRLLPPTTAIDAVERQKTQRQMDAKKKAEQKKTTNGDSDS